MRLELGLAMAPHVVDRAAHDYETDVRTQHSHAVKLVERAIRGEVRLLA